MNNQEKLNQIEESLKKTIEFIQKDSLKLNANFISDYLKNKAIEIYNLSNEINAQIHIENKVPEIKIIKKQELEIREEEIKHTTTEVEKKPEPVIVVEEKPIPIEKAEPKKPLIVNEEDDEDAEEKVNINEKIAKTQQPVVNIADKLKETPIKELVKAISIGKKFEFINELFEGNADAYKDYIKQLESAGSYENAIAYTENNFTETQAWQENEKLVLDMMLLIKRRYMS